MTPVQSRRMLPAALTAMVLLSGPFSARYFDTATHAEVISDRPDGDQTEYSFVWRIDRTQPTYYEIETEFRDSGGVPPLLSYTATIKDRRTITQQLNGVTSQPVAMPGTELTSVAWECTRYEAREQNMKEAAVYDSVRHQFPPGSMRELEAIADSKTAFLLQPNTGAISNIVVIPAQITCPIPRRGTMGKTLERCTLTTANMKWLIESMAAAWFPTGPKRVGDSWTLNTSEPQANIGAIQINTRCTLKSVRESEGTKIAIVDIVSNMKLDPLLPATPPPQPILITPSNNSANHPATQPAMPITPATPTSSQPGSSPASQPTTYTVVAKSGATTRPIAYPRTPRQQSRDFRLEKGAFSGTVEFDLTHGCPVQINLRKEINLVADVESKTTNKMQLRTGTTQLLRIRALNAQPVQPTIVGGKVLPKLSDEEKALIDQLKNTAAMTPAKQPTSRAAAPSTAGQMGSSTRSFRSTSANTRTEGNTTGSGAVAKSKGTTGLQPKKVRPPSRSQTRSPTTRPATSRPAPSSRP